MQAHTLVYRPPMADVDAMGVVYYARYLDIFELGRAELMREAGGPYARLRAEGLELPVTEAALRYRRPARYDDPVVVQTTVAWLRKASMRFDYKLLLEDSPGAPAELVLGHTIHGCVDRSGKVRPLPAWVGQVLAPYLPPAAPAAPAA